MVATKCVGRTGGAAWDQGSSRKHIVEAVEASLRRLGVDRIDLYQLKGELDEITHHYRLGDAAR